MDDFEPIDIDFLINSPVVKEDAAKVKEELLGIGVTAETVTEKTGKKIVELGKKGTQETQLLNQELEKSNATLARQGQIATQTKVQWNGLGNSINQLTRELPAFTYSAQTGFLAMSNNIPILVDEINRLRVTNATAAASGAATIPIWKAVGAAIFSWGTAISLMITFVTVFGKEIVGWVKDLFGAKDAMDQVVASQNAMNEAFKSSEVKGAIEEVVDLRTNLDLAKRGMIDQKTVIDQYNESIGQASEQVKTLNEVEEGLTKNADKFIQATLYKAAALAAQEEIAKEMVELAKEQQRIEDELAKAPEKIEKASTYQLNQGGISSMSEKDLAIYEEERLKKVQEDNIKLQKEKLELGTKLVQNLKEQSLATGLDLFSDEPEEEKKKVDKKGKKVLDGRQSLLDKIAALDAEYARKSFTKDEEELQALKDKFAKVRELVNRFNADPKNKAKRIDLAGLDGVEGQATADLKFRQETATMAKEIDRQREIFKEFEDYKLRFGREKAKEQYGEQIGEYESYMDYLRSLIDRNQDTYSAITTGTASGGQTERYQLLEGEAEAVNRLNLDNNAKLLEQNQTYQDRLLVMQETYLESYQKLMDQGRTAEAKVLTDRYNAEVEHLEDANLKKTEAYKNLFQNVQRMTVANARKLIEAMDEELKHHQVSAEEIAKIEERKAKLLALIRRQSLEDINKIASALGGLGESLSDLGNSTGRNSLAEIGNLMSGLASGVSDLLVAFDSDASSADKIAAGINGIVRLVDMLASAAKRRKEAEEDYYRSVIGFQNQYNLSLNEQIRLQSQLGESVFVKDFEGRIKDGIEALSDANSKYQEALQKLSEGRAKAGQRNAIDWGNVGTGVSAGAAVGGLAAGVATGALVGSVVPLVGTAIGAVVGGLIGLFAGKKKKDTYVPLLEEYKELIQTGEDGVQRLNRELAETLLKQNLVDDATKQLIEDVLAWEDAVKEAREQIAGVVKDLAGSLGDDMRNALVQAFRDGEDAAKAMGETVDKVLENILSQLIFNRIFSDAFKKLEDEMVASQDIGGDGNWIDDFERFFQASKGLGEEFNQAMKDAQAQAAASGFNIFNPTGSGQNESAMVGAIRREVTEETASVLAGFARSTFDLKKREYQLLEAWFAQEQKHYENTLNSYRALVMIEANTANTVHRLDLTLVELKEIKKNTKEGGGWRDNGNIP